MEESEDNMSSEDLRKMDSPSAVKKPKKRSLVERELETNMTARVTSPASGDGFSTSRYGRARRLKTEAELIEAQKMLLASIKSPGKESTPVKIQSPTYRMHASNSPRKSETLNKTPVTYLENQIDNIYQENKSLSRFSEDISTPSPAKKFPKVYMRKDLIQNREEDEPIMLIKNLFSPDTSASKSSNMTKLVESSENYNTKQNSNVDYSSVVKTLHFESNKKKKKDNKTQKPTSSKNNKEQMSKLTNINKDQELKLSKNKNLKLIASKNDKDPEPIASNNDVNVKLTDPKDDTAKNLVIYKNDKNQRANLSKNDKNKQSNVSKNDKDQKPNLVKNDKDMKPIMSKADRDETQQLSKDDAGEELNSTKNDKDKDQKPSMSKNELFEMEAKCPYQVGDLAWARMGTFPFWPCIITREPQSDMFVKKKLFGRTEHDIIHVTFLADNGRRSWLVDNMLRKYSGLLEFEATRDKFTPEDKKKDPRLYAAFFISEKKQALWNTSVEEAETLLREPKRLRIDIFNEILWNSRAAKKNPKSGKIMSRTDSDVSLSESLYDSLFSELEVKTDDAERSKNRSRNKSFDVSEVVTACLDNMAAKTGITKIQRQSHMDRWLQKAKSKTPEKNQAKHVPLVSEKPEKVEAKTSALRKKLNRTSGTLKAEVPNLSSPVVKPYRFRSKTSPNLKLTETVLNDTKNDPIVKDISISNIDPVSKAKDSNSFNIGLDVTNNVDQENVNQDNPAIIIDDNLEINQSKTKNIIQNTDDSIRNKSDMSVTVEVIKGESHTVETKENSDDSAMSVDGEGFDNMAPKKYYTNEGNTSNKHTSSILDCVAEVNDGTSVIDRNDVNYANTKIMKLTDKSPDIEDKSPDAPDLLKVSKKVNANSKSDKEKEVVASSSNKVSKASCTRNTNKGSLRSKVEETTGNITEQTEANKQVSQQIKDLNNLTNDNAENINLVANNINTLKEPSLNIAIDKDQDSIMEVDKITDDEIKTENRIENDTKRAKFIETADDSAMEVDEDANFEVKPKGNTNPKTETVSRKSVEDNVIPLACSDTDLKDTQNVTIEVSVTEKENDDTINNQAQEGHQEGIDKLNTSQDIETKNSIIIFDKFNSNKQIMARANDEILGPNNCTTPEKFAILQERKPNSTENSKLQNCESPVLNSNIHNMCASNDIQKEDQNDTKKEKTLQENYSDKIVDEDNENVFNESAQSDSILRWADDIAIGNGLTVVSVNKEKELDLILETSHNNENTHKKETKADKSTENTIKKSLISEENKSFQSSQINDNKTHTLKEYTDNVINETSIASVENLESTTREYVESPTFTQLLDSEEFFRDVNESNNTTKKSECDITPNSKQLITKGEEISTNKNNEINKIDKVFEYDSEATSDDEPSPEYESLDEEITEDFRKHMLSIENTIKDKNNEEQIVKICNEIAEKAKLSPTKYTTDEEMAKQIHKHDTKSNNTPLINLKDKFELNAMKKDKTDRVITVKLRASSDDKSSTSLQDRLNASIRDVNDSTESNELTTKDKNLLKGHINKSDSIKTRNIPEKHKHHKKRSQKDSFKMNGDATVTEMKEFDSTKVNYRTRRSLNNAIKERTSPNLKISPSKIEQYRKSAEYDPKVMLVRLKQDKMDCINETGKSKPPNEGKFKNNKIALSLQRNNPVSKNSEYRIVRNSEVKSNNLRLSLRRHSPNGKQMENKKALYYELEINVEESKNVSPNSIEKEQAVKNCVPQKINVEDSDKEENIISDDIAESTKIEKSNVTSEVPNKNYIENDMQEVLEPVKVNGYHHNLDRKYTETPDFYDSDFSIDAITINSEDSEVSLPNSVDSIPKRNLRPRADTTLTDALKNPKFLEHLESRQNYLLDENLELSEDELLMFEYKAWLYKESLKSDTKKVNAQHSTLEKITKTQETPSRSHEKKKSPPKNSIKNYFPEKCEKTKSSIDISSENGCIVIDLLEDKVLDKKKKKTLTKSPVQLDFAERATKTVIHVKRKTRSKSPARVDHTFENTNEEIKIKDSYKIMETKPQTEENITPKRRTTSKTLTPKSLEKKMNKRLDISSDEKIKKETEIDADSINSEDSEIPLRQLRSKFLTENNINELDKENTLEKKIVVLSETNDPVVCNEMKEDDKASIVSDNEPLLKQKKKKTDKNSMENPEFLKYLEVKKDWFLDENPDLTQEEVVSYLYKQWLYDEHSKSELPKSSQLVQADVKGLNNNEVEPAKKVRRKPKIEKQTDSSEYVPKEKPRRRIAQPIYNESLADIEDELEMFEIFKTKKSAITVVSKSEPDKDKSNPTSSTKKEETSRITSRTEQNVDDESDEEENVIECVNDTELYFAQLTTPKPNIFKGLIREKVCEICEYAGNLVKCKGCNGMFHPDCVKRQAEAFEHDKDAALGVGRKKKKRGRKPKSLEDSGSHSDEKQDTSVDNISMEEITLPEIVLDVDTFESQMEVKMKEILGAADVNYDSYSSDDGIDWRESVPGKCEIVDVKWKRRDAPIDYSDFKCNNCQKYDKPICFVCRNAISKTGVKTRQKCHVAHCHKYYHLDCLDQWPQTQFNSGEPSKTNKKINEFFEALTCPRHVCHTCISDDPRGCKTRFSGDKLAKCVRCPATYHAFNKCIPAGSQVLTASHIICPRHCEQKPGKVPYHVNTGWCFICVLGGSLICCEYCPMSFHAECLNIKPPEGNYMCEDCETGRLPLYGEMVWVKLGHYRWWPGIILHPSEIPDNIMLVKHELGDFVVRFFGQYDHYWVNRGRVFPYQEGDSGRVYSQKSKIDEDFMLAMEHAQRAYAILKTAEPDGEESLDIESSLLPPHYVKLKCNKPCGTLCGRKMEDPSLSLTQCECNPDEPDPCGPYSQCLNRMLLTECGPTCRAGDRCMNRAFEKRLYPKLVPYRAPNRGWGLKTLENIKAGQFVIEYVGELIDEEEFRRRMRRKHEIRDENFYFLTLDKERMIDAGPKGNAARFMNHCCEPNCETQKWTVLGDVRVGLFAIDDIPANSEVTFNYNLECAGIEKKRCLCGAKRCSGYIGAKPKQNESQSKKGKEKLTAKRSYNRKKKTDMSPSTSKNKSKRLGRPPKPKELTDLEKDVLIIKNAANTISNEETTNVITEEKRPKSLKRKRVSIATDKVTLLNAHEFSVKRRKSEEKLCDVGD